MKKVILTSIGWIISIALLVSLAAKLDLGALWQKLTQARWFFLALAAAVNLVVVALKALRFQWFILPAKRASYGNMFKATMIGLAGNNLLPARGGDWLRVYLLGKWERVSKTMLASVTGVDKLFDGISILIIFGLLSLTSTFPSWVQKGTTIVSIVIAVGLAICLLLLFHHRRTSGYAASELGPLSRLAKRLGQGMGIFTRRKLLVATLVTSVVICLLQIETIRLCQLSFDSHTHIWVPALVFVAINLAIVIPSAPSHIGPYEVAGVLAYSWLGIKAEAGMGIVLAYHAVQFIPVTAIGLIFYFAAGLGRRPKQLIGEEGTEDNAPPRRE